MNPKTALDVWRVFVRTYLIHIIIYCMQPRGAAGRQFQDRTDGSIVAPHSVVSDSWVKQSSVTSTAPAMFVLKKLKASTPDDQICRTPKVKCARKISITITNVLPRHISEIPRFLGTQQQEIRVVGPQTRQQWRTRTCPRQKTAKSCWPAQHTATQHPWTKRSSGDRHRWGTEPPDGPTLRDAHSCQL